MSASLSAPTAASMAASSPNTTAPTPLKDTPKAAVTSEQRPTHTRNAQILEASLQVSIQAGNDGLALLYRTAVDGINTALETAMGPQAIHNAMGQDNSPEATAGRIVALSTAMFDTFAARYPNKNMAEVAQDFVHAIRGGFEQGYREAEDILNSLGVLPDVQVVAQGIAKTFALVQQGYDDWLAQKVSASTPADASSSDSNHFA